MGQARQGSVSLSAIYSMTGYGRGQASRQDRVYAVEARSVNGRYLDIVCRVPRELAALEDLIRARVSDRIHRGRVEVTLSVEYPTGSSRNFILDEEVALQAFEAMKRLSRRLGIDETPSLRDLLTIPDVFRLEEPADSAESAWPAVQVALDSALDELLEMRRLEGDRLRADLLHRIVETEQLISEIQLRSPQVLDDYRQRVAERAQALSEGVKLDQGRLEAEVALFADRASIDEELVRLSSHIEALRGTLQSGGVAGRKLDFILQECNREANTIGSKASDYDIGRLVIEIKSQLEKLREQVQNIE
jgi:uncharacterized protein (TIGR00255 family)